MSRRIAVPVRVVQGLLARLAAWYPSHRGEAAAFLEEAAEEAWATRGWRGLVFLMARTTRDVAATRHRGAPPISALPSRPTGGLHMDRLTQDIRLAFRLLIKTPGFSVVALLTLAFGIGATTTVFTIVDGAILRPFPYPDMDRIVLLTESGHNNQPMSVSWPNFLDWRAQSDSFDELGVYRGMTVNYRASDQTERLNASMVSSSVFQTAGITPLHGRTFGPAEDVPGAPAVALVSERLWRSHFGANEILLNTDISLDGRSYTVVGIMPAGMRFPSRLTDVWLPLGGYVDSFPDRGAHPGLTAVGRLKSGVTIETARANMTTIARRLAEAYPMSNKFNTVVVNSYYELVVRDIRPAMMILLSAVGALLLIACVNLANLLLARAESRQQELTIRAALGAGRGRLARQLLTEALVLATLGGALGVLLAIWGVSAFVASRPTTIPRIDLIGIDWRVVGFAFATTLLTGVLFGLVPAMRLSRPDLHGGVKDGARGVGRGSTRIRSVLVTAELALATVLLVGAALFVKSYAKLMIVDLGFSPSQVVTMRLALPAEKYSSQQSWTALHVELTSRLSALPGIEAVGVSSSLPLGGGVAESSMRREGDPPPSPDQPPTMSSFTVVNDSYFNAMGITLAQGRFFDSRDATGSTLVAIVDDTGAARLFPGESPVGRRIAFETRQNAAGTGDPIWREIVGVVKHVRNYGLTNEPAFVQLYTPIAQLPTYMAERRPAMALVLRTSGAPESAIATVRQTVKGLDAGIPVYGLQTMNEHVGQASEQPRLNATLMGLLSTLSLVLSLIGVYGVLSYAVTRRTREIGLRVALGATQADITRMVGGQAIRLVAAGLAIGTAGALLLTRLLERLLVGVSPTDPVSFVAVIGLLVVCATLACVIPVRRASSVDPAVALRGE